MYPFYIPPEWYAVLGPAALNVPLPPPKKDKEKEEEASSVPSPEDVYWTGVPPVAVTTTPPPKSIPPPPPYIDRPAVQLAKPPSRLKAMLPDLAMAAAAVAQRLAQPRQVGESGMMAATQALVQGYNTLAQLQWMRYAQQMAQRQQQLQELKTLADIARTQEEAKKTQAEARKIHEEADVVKAKVGLDERRVRAFEKQIEGNLQLGRDRLALEADRLAEQVSVDQEKLRQRDRELDLEEKRVGIMERDVASQEDYRKDQVRLQAKRLELERQRNAILERRLQLEVLKAAKEGKSPKELEADLIKEVVRNLPPDADEKDFLWGVSLARRAARIYAQSEYGQPVPSAPSEKGARLVQPSSSEYIRAIETSNGEVYELRRDGQWFRTR
jgi:hypothetical protein